MDSITIEWVSNASSQLFPNYMHAQFIYKFLAWASEFERTMGGSNSRDFSPINVSKRYRVKF